ncbi:GNAT family N-acetyltransferase [Acaryochloris sp. CCMEE 5410]|uniref:GNAT family N-acetyltransferase n=1 Tax=Acaryochloris sp. CCMEE 5410 TaxID=310037 RepID=UPI0002485066|nr:GNAT family N-acetyltransferase [Acaryochloris sp. CCMEE 5410]KAI9129463.1 GNAT family N-acetyltransferase [Acaryochloris sp. CCMEE 5410]
MKIYTPSFEELNFCYELEKSFSSNSEDANEKGFFLPGASFKVYEDLHDTGYIKVLSQGSNLVGFVMVVPPKHQILSRLLINNESLIWFDSEQLYPNVDNCYWIAKIAVKAEFMRFGYAKALYEDVFENFDGLTALTATAVSPLRNHASENFHRALGLKACGLFLSGTKGELTNIVNILWRK